MFDVVSSHVHDLIVNVLSQIDRSTKFYTTELYKGMEVWLRNINELNHEYRS
ncbi:hypothetical protein APHCRT_1503 [Anaplasma phagocytophilum str. CRT53-1]|uniref:Uncharacterized protein n=1 Tax=Anaplasma phagocytophilum str. CRT53-1 TaxID=1359157 RepID=A0A0F3PL90_ANAPH|nr:hypothetical protein APHCRT_1503 [Anaplasma phagocytophilum str. CRT53-1]